MSKKINNQILRAIRETCAFCNNNDFDKIEECEELCPLWLYRNKFPGENDIMKDAIERYCLKCAGAEKGIKNCQDEECPLFNFRPQKN